MEIELARFVLVGKKTGIASLKESYDRESETYPILGKSDIVLDVKVNLVMIIQNVVLSIVPFDMMTEEAYVDG